MEPDAGAAPRSGVEIGPAQRRHAAGVLEIYNHFVASSTAIFDLVPRTLAEQVAWVDEHSGGHPAVVAIDHDGAVVGFGSLSPFRPRPAYATTVENSVYVREGAQRRGTGRRILEELVRLGGAHGFHAMIARIVGHNEASIALHAACGFEVVGTEREVGRKFGRWLDVVEMQRMLG
jgi:phosphinothricin acetyltransferase